MLVNGFLANARTSETRSTKLRQAIKVRFDRRHINDRSESAKSAPLLSNDLYEHTLTSPTIKLTVKDLLPRPEV